VLLGQIAEFGDQLTVREAATAELSHDLAAEDGHRLGVVVGSECIHGFYPFRRSIRRIAMNACTGRDAGLIKFGGLGPARASPPLMAEAVAAHLTEPAPMKARTVSDGASGGGARLLIVVAARSAT
jgi:hypothetical protein